MASKSKSRRRVFRASCILAALIVAGSSFAWFTSRDEVTNRLSASADYGVSITESFTPPEEWVPGQSVNKDTYAVNTGTVDALVMQSVSGKMSINYETTTKTDPKNETDAVKKSKYVTLGTKYSESVQPDGSTVVTSDEITALQAGSTVAYAPLQVAKIATVTYDDTNHQSTGVTYANPAKADPSKCIYPVGKSAIGDSATTPLYYQNIIGAIVTAVDGTYVTKNTTAGNLNSLSLTAGDPDKSDKIGISFDGATFQPNTTGLYIFRRAIDKKDSKTADTTQDYEYVGYYYVQNDETTYTPGSGTYYKVDNEALTAAMKSGDFSSYMNDEGLLLTYKINENGTTAATVGKDEIEGTSTKLKDKEGNDSGTAISADNYYTDDYLTYVYINASDEVTDSSKDTKTGHTQVTTDLEKAITKYVYDSGWKQDDDSKGSIYVVEADKVVTPKLTWHDSADTVDHATNDVTEGTGVNRPIILVATYDNDTTVENFESNYTTAVAGGDSLADLSTTAGWVASPSTAADYIANQKIIVAAREEKYDAAERGYVAAKEAYEAAKAANPSDANLTTLQGNVTTALNKMNADKAAWAKSQGILDAMEKAAADDTIVNIKLTNNAITGAATKAEQWQMITVPMASDTATLGQNQVKPSEAANNYRFADDTAYFYYTSVLESGETSSQLVDSVELDSSVTQYAFKNIDFDLNIGLNSIQHLVAENGDEVIPTVDTKAKLLAGTTEFNELKIDNSTTPLYPKAAYENTNASTEIDYIDWSTAAHT